MRDVITKLRRALASVMLVAVVGQMSWLVLPGQALAAAPVVGGGQVTVISVPNGSNDTYKVSGVVTAQYNDTANDPSASVVTMNFSDFGGSSSVAASPIGENIWQASSGEIPAGTIDVNDAVVRVAVTNSDGGPIIGADDQVYKIDNQAPVVTSGKIEINNGRGAGLTLPLASFIIGDSIAATWNNTAGGDNNSDIVSATADFSQFGGSAVQPMTDVAGTWTASYQVVEGNNNANNRKVSVTAVDDAGNAKTTQDGANRSIENTLPQSSFSSTPSAVTNDTTPEFGGNSIDSGAGAVIDKIEYRIVGPTAVGWTLLPAVDGAYDESTEEFYFETAELDEGLYTAEVRGTDKAGNVESTASYQFEVDLLVPSDASLTLKDQSSGSSSITNSQLVDAVIEDDTDASAWLLSETQMAQPLSSDAGWQTVKPVGFTLSAGDGLKTVYLWTKDLAGNVSDQGKTDSITLDTESPSVTLGTSPNGQEFDTNGTLVFAGTTEAGAGVKLEIFSETIVLQTVADAFGQWEFRVSASEIGVGNHHARVTATDAAGNPIVLENINFRIFAPVVDTTVVSRASSEPVVLAEAPVPESAPSPAAVQPRNLKPTVTAEAPETSIKAAEDTADEGSNTWQTIITIIAIIIIALGVGTAGYYAYEWWATKGEGDMGGDSWDNDKSVVLAKKTAKKSSKRKSKKSSKRGGSSRSAGSRW